MNLIGIKALQDSDEYPFVTVENIDSTHKNINYWYSVNKHTTEKYLYETGDSDWTIYKSFMSDTGQVLIIKKIYKDKVIYLEYEDQKRNRKPLSTIRIFKDNTLISYYLKQSINVKLGLFDSLYLKKPIDGIVKDSTLFENGNIRICMMANNRIENFCYHIGNHNLNWWYTFNRFLDWKKISCECVSTKTTR